MKGNGGSLTDPAQPLPKEWTMTVYTSSTLTAAEITRLYLFGQSEVPADLTSDNVIGMSHSNAATPIVVDAQDYMVNGAGRYALASLFPMVQKFFELGSTMLAPGVYTKDDINALLFNGNGQYTIVQKQWAYDPDSADYATRVHVWNTTQYMLDEGVRFVVGEDGKLSIHNMAVRPAQFEGRDHAVDNFDFNSRDGLAGLAGPYTGNIMDPSKIGTRVEIQFTDNVMISDTVYDYADFMADKANEVEPLPFWPPSLLGKMQALYDDVFATGADRFLDENGRPILYGTNGADSLNSFTTAYGNFVASHRHYSSYLANGVVLVGGDGNDEIRADDSQSGPDALYGGSGNDRLFGSFGKDELYGGKDDDVYRIGDAEDRVIEYAGEGTDTVETWVDFVLPDHVENLRLYEDPDILTTIGSDLNGTGNALDNKIWGNSFDNVLRGEGGKDYIEGGDGNDTIAGGTSDDQIFGGEDDDVIDGGDDNDELYGQDDNDELKGGSGRDYLDGGDGSDKLFGGSGYDFYRADESDTIDDEDGAGRVHMDGLGTLTGGKRKESDPQNEYRNGSTLYVLDGTTLTINGGLTINNFSNGELGIFLETEEDEEEEEDEEGPDTGPAERRTSPIVIDLDGDGVETTGMARDRYFDHDANGMRERTAWASPDDGFLVRDLNGNGRIDDGREMFGNQTRLGNGALAANGFEALRELDGNQDGVIDATDAAFASLRIWRDANSNGRTDLGELLTMEQAGLAALRTSWQNSSHVDANGQAHAQVGTAVRSDGTVAAAADVWFQVDTTHRINDQVAGSAWLALADLPDAKAFGNLPDLRQAMAADPELKAMVETFVSATDPAVRENMLEGLIFQWAGVADVDPNSRDPRMVYGHVMDARQLIVLEQLVGRGYEGTWCWGERDPNPHGNAAPLLIAEFKKFQNYVRAQLLAQTDAASYGFIRGGFGSGYASVVVDWAQFHEQVESMRASGDIAALSEIVSVVRGLGTYSPSFRGKADRAFSDLQAEYPDLAPVFNTPSLIGTQGRDTLFGGSQGEVIVGDKGDDTIFGGGGNDNYYYRVGDGKDRVYDSSGVDQLVFMDGIVAGDVSITRDLTSLFVAVNAGGSIGEIRIDNVFDENGHLREGVIEQIKFQDGTTWAWQDILSHIAMPVTPGDDTLYGNTGADVLSAQAGNDRLLGLDGDDALSGEAGDDTLVGGNGNDILDGGAGNDMLNGGAGNDTYVFASGFGNDVIENYDDTAQRMDVVQFAAGISASNVMVSRSIDDLVLTLSSGDTLRVRYHYSGEGSSRYGLNEVRFADGTVWDAQALRAKALGGTAGDDSLTGYSTDDVLQGLDGNDYLRGNGGNDQLSGDAGDDFLFGDGGTDQLAGGAGDDRLSGGEGDDLLEGGLGQDRLEGGYGADVLSGGEGDDELYGEGGDDQLRGGLGNDTLEGGHGDDRYYFARGDGKDTIHDAGGQTTIYVSDLSLQQVYFRREETSLVIRFGDSTDDEIRLRHFFGIDGLALGGLRIDPGNGQPWDISAADLDAQVLLATTFDDVIQGNAHDNLVQGLGGNDTLHGYGGADQLDGGDGNDVLVGGNGDDTLTGGIGDDVLDGGEGNDQMTGGDGIDSLSGGAGNDVLDGGFGGDVLDGGTGVDTLSGGAGNDRLLGSDGDDELLAADGNDELDGGTGTDRMTGGTGDDVYTVDDIGDVVTEAQGEGDDRIRSSVSLTIAAHVETLELVGAGDVSATGDAGDNQLIGNVGNNVLTGLQGDDYLEGRDGDDHLVGGEGNDVLDGGYGTDTLEGGSGNDQYRVDSVADTIVENAGEGDDTVLASGSYQLSANLESLLLMEQTSAYDGFGNDQDNSIIGNSYGNRIDGRGGEDVMQGHEGDDIYVVDNVGDEVVEFHGQGHDSVEASIDYVLGDTLENLTLTGTADLDGTGNAQDNMLIGNDGNNRLDGGLGGDLMLGGNGNDVFVNDSGDDWIVEVEDEGTDTVERRYETNLILSDNVENLVLVQGVTTGNGNDLDNTIIGNSGANTLGGWAGDDVLHGLDGEDSLFGGSGADLLYGGNDRDYLDGGEGVDRLEGGAGNDVYVTDDANDVVVEAADGGTDQVQTTATYALSGNIENLFLMGDGAIDGTGNGLDNYIAGNDAANVIHGLGGSDTIVGAGGNDTLIGGAGDDKYVVNASSGTDIVDNTGGGFDGVFFTDGIVRERLSFARDGNDLLISVDNAATPAVRVVNHFLGGDAAIDYVQPDGGFYLTTAQINQIVAGGGTGFDQVIEGTAAGEQLVGGSGKDLIKGLAGADQLFGMGGNDTLQGGDGDDYLSGGNGGGTGSADDRLEGGIGNDTLAGEDGNDTLLGGAGDDDYVYGYGGGQDIIDNTGGGYDGVFFNNGITAAQLAFTRSGDDLVITVGGNASNTMTVTNHFLGGDSAIDYVQPASGAMLDTAAINALVGGGSNPPGGGNDGDYPSVVTGTAAGEQLLGTNDRDLIKGLGGNDTVFGFNGDDKLDGGDGDDYLSGGNGSHNGSGNDIILGGAGADQLVGEDGNDQMFGGTGNDKYIYGGGADTIDNTGGGTDWLHFNSSAFNVARNRITFHRDADDLIVRVDGDAAKQVRVLKHFLGGEYAIAYVQPGSGNAIPASQFGGLLTPLSSTAPVAQLDSETPLAVTASTAVEALDAKATSAARSDLDWERAMESFDARATVPAAANDAAPPSRELQTLVEAMSSFGGSSEVLAGSNMSTGRFEDHLWSGGPHQHHRNDGARLRYMEP
ncbi:calcium-binding protein [Lysobacter soli]